MIPQMQGEHTRRRLKDVLSDLGGIRLGGRLLAGFNVLVYVYLLAPILIIIPISFSEPAYVVFPPIGFSFRWYLHFFSLDRMTDALWLSLCLGIVVSLVSTTIGTLASYALVRYWFRGREALRTLFTAPLTVPGVVLGIALLIFISRTPLVMTFWSLFFAHVVITIPYVIRVVVATMLGFDRELENAAASLGANPFATFRTVTLPLIKPGIIAGAIFAFVMSFDELVVSMFLVGPGLTTLPVQIFNYVEFASDPMIAAVSVLLVLFTTIAVLILDRLVGFTQFV